MTSSPSPFSCEEKGDDFLSLPFQKIFLSILSI